MQDWQKSTYSPIAICVPLNKLLNTVAVSFSNYKSGVIISIFQGFHDH